MRAGPFASGEESEKIASVATFGELVTVIDADNLEHGASDDWSNSCNQAGGRSYNCSEAIVDTITRRDNLPYAVRLRCTQHYDALPRC